MPDTSSNAPADWYPDQTTADTIRYWDGMAWTAHWASAQPSPRDDYWSRYWHRYLVTAGVLGALGAVTGFLSRTSDAVPEGGSYSYALGQAIGTAIVFGCVMIACAFVVKLLVALIPPKSG